MNRAMFSGVAGLKAHQTKMDVIGNNIANVNTFGYKSQRAVFSDIYYQNLRNASAGSANRGGTNPSSVGYGSNLSAIQANMSQSSMQNTGFGLDVAIAGDGFLQVMDPDGNIFYTKAGLLDYDSNGYLTDINGNFVLGASDPKGKPDSQKIKLDNMGAVDAKQPTVTKDINGVKYTVTTSNATEAGNFGFTLSASDALPAGQKAVATISSSGAVIVQLNAKEQFSSMMELNNAINNAVTAANGGKQIPAGTITLTSDKNVFGKDAAGGIFKGSAMADKGTLSGTKNKEGNFTIFGGKIEITGNTIDQWGTTPNEAVTYTIADTAPDWTMTATIGPVTYTGKVPKTAPVGTNFTMTATASATGTITMALKEPAANLTAGADSTSIKANPPMYFFGGASITGAGSNLSASGSAAFSFTKTSFPLEGKITVGGIDYIAKEIPASGGSVTFSRMDKGTPPAAIPNDNIVMNFPSSDVMKKNLGLASTTTDADLITKLAATLNAPYHTYSLTAATAAVATPLTGAQIAEANKGVDTGTLDFGTAKLFDGAMTFMKAGTEFAGSGDVKGVKADFSPAANGEKAFWTLTIKIGDDGREYTTTISEDTTASSLLLKGPGGENDSLQMTNPTFNGIKEYYKKENKGGEPGAGSSVDAISNGTIKATPSTPSKNLGLGDTFSLTGGTSGGTITLDQLTNIAIGADGTVSVSHATKGTVAVGKISLANFANNGGLQLEGQNYYTASSNSGLPVLCDPGTKGTGALKNSALEMSNVDLSAEFSDMITTQRGFQANSRIITVSDTMLEELINLKR